MLPESFPFASLEMVISKRPALPPLQVPDQAPRKALSSWPRAAAATSITTGSILCIVPPWPERSRSSLHRLEVAGHDQLGARGLLHRLHRRVGCDLAQEQPFPHDLHHRHVGDDEVDTAPAGE